MPLTLHDTFTQNVVFHIENALGSFRVQDSPLSTWANDIRCTSTSDIFLEHNNIGNKRSKRSPNCAFRHKRAKYPGLVIEVSYSQKAKDLSRLADDYILGSNGNIHTVIGLDLEYGGLSAARLYRWQATFIQDDSNEEELSAKLITDFVRVNLLYLTHILTDCSRSGMTIVTLFRVPGYCCILWTPR